METLPRWAAVPRICLDQRPKACHFNFAKTHYSAFKCWIMFLLAADCCNQEAKKRKTPVELLTFFFLDIPEPATGMHRLKPAARKSDWQTNTVGHTDHLTVLLLHLIGVKSLWIRATAKWLECKMFTSPFKTCMETPAHLPSNGWRISHCWLYCCAACVVVMPRGKT